MECEKSAEYWRRQELIKTLEVPTISEAKKQLGDALAKVVFCECPECLCELFGLQPPLEGPGDLLWVSPSDLLIGKVCLKPPLTQKHIQALTHQGILEIGGVIEKKYWNEMKLQRKRALEEQEDFLERMFDVKLKKIIAELKSTERERYVEQLEMLKKYYERQIAVTLYDLAKDMRDQEEKFMREHEELNKNWQEKFDEEIAKTVKNMNEQLLEKLRDQENLLVEIFTKRITNMEANHKCALEFERIKCSEALMQLKHNLECRNVANLMYMLCKERRRCMKEKNTMENNYKQQLAKHKRTIITKNDKIEELIKIKDKKTRQINMRERCLIEIIKQYRKLINFALSAAPTQAEYLLNVQKLLKYEIDDYCFQKQASKAMPKTAFVKKEDKSESNSLLKLMDLRDGSETSSPSEESNLEESDVLPAFYFNNRMYVREDFRDMFSQGIEIDRKHPLWNKDVFELMNIFKATMEAEKTSSDKRSGYEILSKSKSHLSSVHFENLKEVAELELKEEEQQTKSTQTEEIEASVKQKRHIIADADSIELKKESLTSDIIMNERRISPKSLQAPSSQTQIRKPLKGQNEFSDFEDFTKSAKDRATSKLTLARDSIILTITAAERKSVVGKISLPGREQEVEEEIDVHEESQEENQTEDLKSTSSLQKSSLSTSKLVLASDSLELLKSSCKIGLLSEKTANKDVKSTSPVKRKSKDFQKRPLKKGVLKPTAKVAGDRKAQEHLQTPNEFTNERINSLVNLIKGDPSLIRLFTPCS